MLNTILLTQIGTINVQADSNKASSQAKANLAIPKNASKVFANSGNHVQYQVEGAVKLNGSDGSKKTVSETVDSSVISETDSVTQGVTTISADLSQAQDASNTAEINPLSIGKSFIKNIFETTAYASVSNNTNSSSTWDKTLGLNIYMTVYWTSINNNSLVSNAVTGLSGGYTRADSTLSVTSSTAFAATNANTFYQQKSWNLGSNSSWSISTGFSPVQMVGAVQAGGKYSVNISRGGSSWSVALNQNVFNAYFPAFN